MIIAGSPAHLSPGDQHNPAILFIHGTPGVWTAFEKYLNNEKLQQQYFMVSVDRLGWVVRGKLKKSNYEILTLSEQLSQMEQTLVTSRLDAHIIVMQGSKDKLVSPRNVDYIRQMWTDNQPSLSIIELPKAGHFLPWKNTGEVIRQIEKLTANP